MANQTPCQTPGSQFHTHISSKRIETTIDLPDSLNLTEAQAELLDINIHNALELALAPYFVGSRR